MGADGGWLRGGKGVGGGRKGREGDAPAGEERERAVDVAVGGRRPRVGDGESLPADVGHGCVWWVPGCVGVGYETRLEAEMRERGWRLAVFRAESCAIGMSRSVCGTCHAECIAASSALVPASEWVEIP